jgi:hypothetical protein
MNAVVGGRGHVVISMIRHGHSPSPEHQMNRRSLHRADAEGTAPSRRLSTMTRRFSF